MYDRLPAPGKENRVRITQDDGNIVEGVLSYADDATVQGSAYCKANVLPDEVCAALGLDGDTAEPKDALAVLTAQQTAIAAKCEIVCGVYTGDSNGSQTINLGFYPLAVLISCPTTSYGDDRTAHNLALRNYPARCAAVTSNGFQVSGMFNNALAWRYIAFKV